ncbi:MAG: hypothetical protein U0794_08910 [Isosphaeraceae bacterium]
MSTPYRIALLGFVLVVGSLLIQDLARSKSAGPLIFLIGGSMTLGGLAIGLLRSARHVPGEETARRPRP